MMVASLSGGVTHVARWTAVFLIFATTSAVASADELLYAYEADVAPYDSTAGWLLSNPCDPPTCAEVLSDGAFGLMFDHPPPGESAHYNLWIANPPNTPPPSLWVEWQYRSNHPLGPNYYNCDGRFTVLYEEVFEVVNTYGNAAISFSGDDFVYPLDLGQFHSYRFECLDGRHYRITVNGIALTSGEGSSGTGGHFLNFGSLAASTCHDWVNLPFVLNEWDFIRYGTIGFGERIVAADPPTGFLYPGEHASRDRFTVTYDSPNYAYIDDITVSVSCASAPNCPEAPQVIATKRLDNGPPDVLEIVLDRPFPPNARTVFTFTDVDPTDPEIQFTQTVSYTFQLGDSNADGRWDLLDFAALQRCFFALTATNTCAAFDFNGDIFVDSIDHAAFLENAFP